jgi:hypothetical protein
MKVGVVVYALRRFNQREVDMTPAVVTLRKISPTDHCDLMLRSMVVGVDCSVNAGPWYLFTGPKAG